MEKRQRKFENDVEISKPTYAVVSEPCSQMRCMTSVRSGYCMEWGFLSLRIASRRGKRLLDHVNATIPSLVTERFVVPAAVLLADLWGRLRVAAIFEGCSHLPLS
jgi:hypothetical protein